MHSKTDEIWMKPERDDKWTEQKNEKWEIGKSGNYWMIIKDIFEITRDDPSQSYPNTMTPSKTHGK